MNTEVSMETAEDAEEAARDAYYASQKWNLKASITDPAAMKAFLAGGPVFYCSATSEEEWSGIRFHIRDIEAAIEKEIRSVKVMSAGLLSKDPCKDVWISVSRMIHPDFFAEFGLTPPLFDIGMMFDAPRTVPESEWYPDEWHDAEGGGFTMYDGARHRTKSLFIIPLDVISGPEQDLRNFMREGILKAIEKLGLTDL